MKNDQNIHLAYQYPESEDREKVEVQSTDIGELLEIEIPHLRRYALSLTRNIDQADDLVYDGIVRAIEKSDQWQPGSNLRAWLIVILRNLFFDQWRRSKLEQQAINELPQPVNSTFPTQETDQELREVSRQFDELSVNHREILTLVVMQELDYETTAQILGVKIGTVKSRLSRARSELRMRCEISDL